jgi:dihydroxyacid dehydratase/phosphogluconate dehydratase
MPSGVANQDKARIRKLYAEGKASRAELLESECGSYHSAGTCTFYGTAYSNQMLMEIMGLHLPGSAFIPPNTPLRDALTAAMRKTSVDSPRGKFTLSAAGNPVQDIYVREVKGKYNESRGVAAKALADPARGCKL